MLERVKHLGSIATDKYIVIAIEKAVISDKADEQDSGFYITALDRNNSEDTKDVSSRAEKIEKTTGMILLQMKSSDGISELWFSRKMEEVRKKDHQDRNNKRRKLNNNSTC